MPVPRSTPARVLGERVKAHRNALGISQETLADRSSVHWTFVGQVERGQRNLNLHNLLKIAHGLQVDPSELIHGLTPTSGLEPRARHRVSMSGPAEHAEGVRAFARNVRTYRARRGLSQSQVSKRSGIHVTEVSRIERGLRDPRMSTLVRLARALETPPARLLNGV